MKIFIGTRSALCGTSAAAVLALATAGASRAEAQTVSGSGAEAATAAKGQSAGALDQATTSDPATRAVPEDPTAQQRGGPELEDIVVTADRRNSFSTDYVQAGSFRGARQLDTPLTVSVIPRELIDSQQAKGLLDALRNTAGVTSSQTAPTVYSNLAIRGINVENRGNYRLNGALPIINLIDLPLEDKDRVEALKGASALYYGFTTPSGIINLTMKRPTRDPLLAIDVSGNDHGQLLGHVDIGGTSGIFGYRVNGVYGQVDPGIDNTRGTRSLISGAFDLKPTDTLTVSFDAEHIFKKVNEPGVYRFILIPASTAANPYPAIRVPALIDPSTNFGPDWAFNRAEETNLLGAVNWKISPAWAFTASGGTSRLMRDRHFNTLDPNNPNTNPLRGAVGEYPLSIGYQPRYKAKNRNIRAEVAGTFDTGPLTHEILIGAAQNVRRQDNAASIAQNCIYNNTTGALQGAQLGGTAPAGTTLAACRQSIVNPHTIPQLGEPLPTYTSTQINDTGYYVFDRIKLGEWLQVLGGVRKSDYTEKNLTTDRITFQSKPTSFSYGAVLKPVQWASAYATYIEGLEATPGAPATASNAGVQLPATESKQKEAGIKIEPKPGLLAQVAYFDIERASTFVNGANVYVQDGQARYRGVEYSLTGEITRDLSLYISGLFLGARQVSGAATVTTPTFSPTIVGKRIENTPRRTFSASAEYRLTSVLPGLSVNGGLFYIGARAINALNQAFVPGYTLFDLGGAYKADIGGRPTTFRVNAQNITGKRYWASTGGAILAQGAPAAVKFSVATVF